jgi:hypothetical protein
MQSTSDILALGFSTTIADRLNAKLVRRDNGCLDWTGSTTGSVGHGHIARGGGHHNGNEATHRVAWMLEYGRIPEDKFVLHRCDSPACAEPTHLYLGDDADKVREMDSKGRRVTAHGETHSQTKLSDYYVAQLRADAPYVSYATLAAHYGISATHARNLALGIGRAPTGQAAA